MSIDLAGHLEAWLQQWGYLAVFLGVMVENAGIPVPGETTIMLATVLASRGQLQVAWVYPAAVAGAIVGDNLGYWLGRWLGRPLLHKLARIWHLNEAEVERAERAFQRQGAWAVLFGRFIALLRTLAGPMAGSLGMQWPRFFLFNAIGAVLWAGVIVALSYAFGRRIEQLLHHAGLVLMVMALGATWWAWRRFRRARGTNAPQQD